MTTLEQQLTEAKTAFAERLAVKRAEREAKQQQRAELLAEREAKQQQRAELLAERARIMGLLAETKRISSALGAELSAVHIRLGALK